MHDEEARERQDAAAPPEAPAGEEAASAGGEAPAAAAELARLRAEKDELLNTLVRRQADFENYRKRIERERAEDARRGMARLIEGLLPVLDAFERALRAPDGAGQEEYRKGVELIYRQLFDALARHGLERIEAAGRPFDPHVHQAIERVETRDHPDGTVVEVVQEGYQFHGRVLRPSVVRVAAEAAPAASGEENSPAARREAD